MRVIAHAHSSWSHDSSLRLSEWIGLARERAVGAVLMTEHEEAGWTGERYARYVDACRDASAHDVTLIPGIEFSQDRRHLLCYGLAEFPERPSSPEALARAVRAQGRWLCLAHPAKYRWDFPSSVLAAVEGVEVWNSKWIYDGELGPHPRSLGLAAGKLRLAGQDVHKTKHLSRIFIETPSANVLGDIAAGRHALMAGGRRILVAELGAKGGAGLAQRTRTFLLRHALRSYGWARRVGTLIGGPRRDEGE